MTRHRLLALGLVMVACVDRSGTDSADDLGASESSDSAESSSSSESGDTTTTTTDSSTGEASSTDASGSTSESTTESSESTTESTTGMLEEVTYVARAYVGQIDRMFIYRLDPFTDTCTKLSLAYGGSPNPEFPDLAIPMLWSFEYARQWDGLLCEGSPGRGVFATVATGMVQFNDYDPQMAIFPCNIDVVAQFQFDGASQPIIDFDVLGLVPTDMLSGC